MHLLLLPIVSCHVLVHDRCVLVVVVVVVDPVVDLAVLVDPVVVVVVVVVVEPVVVLASLCQ